MMPASNVADPVKRGRRQSQDRAGVSCASSKVSDRRMLAACMDLGASLRAQRSAGFTHLRTAITSAGAATASITRNRLQGREAGRVLAMLLALRSHQNRMRRIVATRVRILIQSNLGPLPDRCQAPVIRCENKEFRIPLCPPEIAPRARDAACITRFSGSRPQRCACRGAGRSRCRCSRSRRGSRRCSRPGLARGWAGYGRRRKTRSGCQA